MNYLSTRGDGRKVNPAQALIKGIAEDKGLFVPENLHVKFDVNKFLNKNYEQIAEIILSEYFSQSGIDIASCVNGAYKNDNFYTDAPVKISYADDMIFLELFHGKTAAFKDMALSILPYLMKGAMKAQKVEQKIVILTATSGDTGKSALEAFKDIDFIEIIVFFPKTGVSAVQKRHMQSQEGSNVHVVGIDGNFDDAQTAVKKAFDSGDVKKAACANGKILSSANSINIGRLFPQTVYYWYAYMKLIEDKKIKIKDAVNFCVPTGNFGNILAGYYAKEAGLPAGKFICASNENNVLTDFINTGVYDKNREFKKTISPSMDILISSNLERLIYHLSGNDGEYVKELMGELKTNGAYRVREDIKAKTESLYFGSYANEKQIMDAMRSVYEKSGYMIDPHTAAGVHAYKEYIAKTGDNTPCVILSTANAYKFADSVLEAIFGIKEESFKAIETLGRLTNIPVHPALAGIAEKRIIHRRVCKPDEIEGAVIDIIGEEQRHV
jgi:threonine synthase